MRPKKFISKAKKRKDRTHPDMARLLTGVDSSDVRGICGEKVSWGFGLNSP
jgi:hypothetical protein